MNNIIKIAIVGLGQVGNYLYNEINLKKKDIELKTGKKIKIVAISAKSKDKKRKFTIDKNSLPKFYSWLFNQKNILPIYQPRKINSIYFDDIFFKSATDNLSGVEKRKKYRKTKRNKNI